jgi:hypothetical protein
MSATTVNRDGSKKTSTSAVSVAHVANVIANSMAFHGPKLNVPVLKIRKFRFWIIVKLIASLKLVSDGILMSKARIQLRRQSTVVFGRTGSPLGNEERR